MNELFRCRTVPRRTATPHTRGALTALAALGVLCAAAAPSHAQIFEWQVALGGNGHFYQPVSAPNGITWTDANAAAVAAGGYLATPTSAAENTFVFNVVDNPLYWDNPGGAFNALGPWLGGFQAAGSPEPAGGWQWVNGEGAFAFTNWAPGEPNDTNGIEDRLNFRGTGSTRVGFWNDFAAAQPIPGFPNYLVRGYVIEFNTNPASVAAPEPGSLSLLAVGLLVPLRRLRKPRR